MHSQSFIPIFAAGLLVVPSALGFCGSRLSHFHKRQEGEAIPQPKFGYNETAGPVVWHLLDPEFATCELGSSQSPIIVQTASAAKAEAGTVVLDIPIAKNVAFENLGTTVEVITSGTLKTADTGDTWNLKQFHFHTPSEHRIDLQHFDAEIHMVHEAADGSGRIAVAAFLVNVSHRLSTIFLEDVLKHVDAVAQFGQTTEIPELDMGAFARKASEGAFFTYSGSLTTPPCTEGVTWYISETPLNLDARTFLNLRKVTTSNNRFTQNAPTNTNLLELARSIAPKAAPEAGVVADGAAKAEPVAGEAVAIEAEVPHEAPTVSDAAVEVVLEQGEAPVPAVSEAPVAEAAVAEAAAPAPAAEVEPVVQAAILSGSETAATSDHSLLAAAAALSA